MNFLEKNTLYNRLKRTNDPVKDRLLLAKRNPESAVLKTRFFDKTKEANALLDALLNVATEEEIVNNRLGKKAVAKEKRASSKTDGIKKKSGRKSGKRSTT